MGKESISAKAPRRLRLLRAITILLLFAILGLVFHAPLLRGVARQLIVSDNPTQADAIVLLNGNDNRALTAAQLYAKRYASRVLIAQAKESPSQSLNISPNSTEVLVALLMSEGVPRDSISVLAYGSGVTSTFDEAIAHTRYMHDHQIERVLLVTSAFHTRRARWAFNRVSRKDPHGSGERATQPEHWKGDIVVVGSPHVGFDESNWWKTERGLVTLNNEYLKLGYYILTKRGL